MIAKLAPLVALFALAAAAAPSHAACDGLSGKDLKKCEKRAKAQAKADARTTPYIPSELDGSLSSFDSDNPFATDDYRVRVHESLEIRSVDDYLAQIEALNATVTFSRYLVDEAAAGNAEVIAAVPTLVKMIAEVPGQVTKLVEDGKALPNNLGNELTGPDAMKIPKATAAIKDGVVQVTAIGVEAVGVAKSLGALAADPGAAVGAAAGAGLEAAGAAVGNPCDAKP